MLLTLRILVWRVRRLALLACVVAAACLVARQTSPPGEPTLDIVVAARDLAAGRELTAEDLRTVAVPTSLVPAGAVTGGTVAGEDLTGRRVMVDVPAGLPLVVGLLDGGRFGLDPPDGTVTVPVRLADPAVAAMLRPGDRVDLVAPTVASGDDADADPGVLAAGALVLDVVAADTAEGDGLVGWTGSQTTDPLVVVAVEPAEGHRLAASAWDGLGAVLVGGS